MAYGLRINNDSNEIIVDSDFKHYHFAGKGQFLGSFVTPDIIGGNVTDHSYSGSTTISSGQNVGTVFRFSLSARATSVSPVPLVFIKTHSSARMGHIMTKRDGQNWEFWILSDQTGTPDIYCFLPLDEMSTASATPASGETHGIATFSSSGARTYDSRIKPLNIVGNVTVPAAPTSARTSITANYNPNFAPNTQTSTTFSYPNSQVELMYCCPSISHACQEVSVSNSGDGFQPQGAYSYFYAWARVDLWWGFYRNTYRLTTVNNQRTVVSGYTPYAFGHVWKSVEDSSSILGVLTAVALSFATFGASLLTLGVLVTTSVLVSSFTGVAADSGLYYPYSNDTRNRGEVNPMLLAKWSQYD